LSDLKRLTELLYANAAAAFVDGESDISESRG